MTGTKYRSWASGNFWGDREIGQKKAQLAKVEWKSKICKSLLLKQIGANNEKGERYSLWLL